MTQCLSGSGEPHRDWFVVRHCRHARRDQVQVRPKTLSSMAAVQNRAQPRAPWQDRRRGVLILQTDLSEAVPVFFSGFLLSAPAWTFPHIWYALFLSCFSLFTLVFMKTRSGELLCPSVNEKQQECDLRIYFFEYQIKMQLLQLVKRSKDVKM